MELEINTPDTWQERRIRDLGEVVTGRTPSTKRKNFYGGEYSLISPADLDNGKYVFTAHKRLSRQGFRECRALPKHTVLVGCIGNVGKLGMVADDRSSTNQQINAVIVNPENDAHFLYYCLHASRSRLERAADKTTLPILNKTNFENFEIAVPPLTEQRKIARVLGVVQWAIEQQERLIALTMELKKTLLHKLFTEGLCGEPQKQTDIGPVPQSWDVRRIGDYCASSAFGPRFGSNLYSRNGNIVTLRTTDLDDDGNIDFREAPKARLELNKFEGHLLCPNDVVVSRSGTCGIAAVFEGYDLPVLPGAFLIRLRLSRGLRPQFLRYYINSPDGRPRISNIAQGAIQKNISGTALKNFEVPIPDLEEQQQIERHVETIDRKLGLQTKKHSALTALFRTLLHQLMTAQIRVHELCANFC